MRSRFRFGLSFKVRLHSTSLAPCSGWHGQAQLARDPLGPGQLAPILEREGFVQGSPPFHYPRPLRERVAAQPPGEGNPDFGVPHFVSYNCSRSPPRLPLTTLSPSGRGQGEGCNTTGPNNQIVHSARTDTRHRAPRADYSVTSILPLPMAQCK